MARYAQFTPAEAERITGLSADMQRTWRKRGLLPLKEGVRSTFDALELASMRVRVKLAKQGFPPSKHDALSDKFARIVLWHALMDVHQACEVRGEDDDVAAFRKEFEDGEAVISRLVDISVEHVHQFWVALDSGEAEFQSDLTEFLTGERQDSEVGFFIDFLQVGRRLGRKAGRALVVVDTSPAHVEFEGSHELSMRLPAPGITSRRSMPPGPPNATGG